MWFLTHASGQSYRVTDRQTDRQTYKDTHRITSHSSGGEVIKFEGLAACDVFTVCRRQSERPAGDDTKRQ